MAKRTSPEERQRVCKAAMDMVRETIDDRLEELQENASYCDECSRTRTVSDGEILYCDEHRRQRYLLEQARPQSEKSSSAD